jgi:hypothetical protein
VTDATKHMPTDPNARALTIGGKSVGGAPPAPVVLYIRGNDVLNSAREVIVSNGQEPLKAAIARLKYQNLDPLTHVSVYADGHMVRLADGRLKDLA